MDKLAQWLEQHGLRHCHDILAAQRIDLGVLPNLTEEHLRELGLALGDRIRLLEAIARLGPDNNAPTSPAQPDTTEGERRQLTIMFCDLVGSTELSSRLSLDDYRDVLRSYQEAVQRIVGAHGGYIARYMGDGVMVYFGYPLAAEDDAERAVIAALHLVPAIITVKLPDGQGVHGRIGIATGTVVVGDLIGEGIAEERAVLGVTPNLAARLQAEAKPDEVVISPTTHALTAGRFDTRSGGERPLKGIDGPVEIIKVLARRDVSRFQARVQGTLTPMVGRSAELELLERRWGEARRGNGGGCLITGAAGLGKSRLVEALLLEAGPGKHLIRCSCSPHRRHTPLYPIIREIERAAGFTDADAADVRRRKLRSLLEHTAPKALRHLDLFAALVIDDQHAASTHNLMDAVSAALVEYVVHFAERRPVIVVFEDMHWADPTTLTLVERIAARVNDAPVLVVATARPSAEQPFANAQSGISLVNLTRLTRDEARELVRHMPAAASAGQAAVETVIGRADGVPLFLEQLAHSLDERGSTPRSIPATLKDSLTARLDGLGTSRQVAQVAAVLGREFALGMLREVAALDAASVANALAELEQHQIISPRSFDHEPSYQFQHALIRDAAYESLLRDRRHEIHRRAAAALLSSELDGAERAPDLIAHHYEAAGDWQPALRYWEAAGRRARQHSANREAAHHFAHAVSLLARHGNGAQPDAELRLRIELGAQLIACHGNGAPEVEDNYAKADALVAHVSDAQLGFRARHGLRTFYMVRGPLERARELGELLLEMAARSDDSQLSIQAHRTHGLTLFALGQLEPAVAHLREVIGLYVPEEHGGQRFEYISDPLVLARCNLGWALAFLGEADEAVDACGRAIELAEALDHKHSLAFALSLAAATRQALDDRSATLELARKGHAVATDSDFPYWRAWNEMLIAWSDSTDTDTNEAGYDTGMQAYEKTGARMMLPYFLTLRAQSELATGDARRALATLDAASAAIEVTDTRFYQAELMRLRAHAAFADSAPPREVREHLQSALALARGSNNRLLAAKAEQSINELLGPRTLMAVNGGR